MKVAFITNFCTHYRYKLFTSLAHKYGVDFYFFDDAKKTKEDIRHLKIFRGGEKFFHFSQPKIIRHLFRIRYDVIIKCTNKKWFFFSCFLLAKILRKKFIVWHSMWHTPETVQFKYFSWLLNKVLRDHTDAVVVYGEHGKRFLLEEGIGEEKIFIGWQTVDNEVFGRDVRDDEIIAIQRRFNIPEEKKIVLFVGRFITSKGIEYLLEALKIIDDGNLLFMGVGTGELKNMMEKYCRTHMIDCRLTGLIPYEDLPPLYNVATMMVLPSITTKTQKEPWGLVVNEAFNQGCPVVVTDAVGAGAGGLVRDGVNGFIVPERDVSSLANALGTILKDDRLRDTLSRNAREEIKRWTYERQCGGFLESIEYSLKRDR